MKDKGHRLICHQCAGQWPPPSTAAGSKPRPETATPQVPLPGRAPQLRPTAASGRAQEGRDRCGGPALLSSPLPSTRLSSLTLLAVLGRSAAAGGRGQGAGGGRRGRGAGGGAPSAAGSEEPRPARKRPYDVAADGKLIVRRSDGPALFPDSCVRADSPYMLGDPAGSASFMRLHYMENRFAITKRES